MVDKYQITSDEQRATTSKIIQGNAPKCKEVETEKKVELDVSVTDKTCPIQFGCTCKKSDVNMSNVGEVSTMLNQILNNRKGQKTVIKLEIICEKRDEVGCVRSC